MVKLGMRRVILVMTLMLFVSGCAFSCGVNSSSGYKSCEEARNAGEAPLHSADAGWNSKLDRDGDGVACE